MTILFLLCLIFFGGFIGFFIGFKYSISLEIDKFSMEDKMRLNDAMYSDKPE